jgi:BirA family transcriptional regulator, biotin operon repressor / biotin---[acetyl-CoA-carboxylase] ligase
MQFNTNILPHYICEEIKQRKKQFPPYLVDKVFKYGAVTGSHIHQFKQLPRGMDKARQLIKEYEETERSFPSGTVIIAEKLSGSRGRFQRVWHAPPGGIWMTLVLVNTLLPQIARLLPLAIGIACCELAMDYGINSKIKWINDIIFSDRKLAGILLETFKGVKYNEEYILIGIGIDVNNTKFPEELKKTATSFKKITGRSENLEQVFFKLLAKLAWNIGLIHQEEHTELQQNPLKNKNLPTIINQWKKLSDTPGKWVEFGYDLEKQPQFIAKAADIDKTGGLILKLDNGSIITEHTGEIRYL